MDFDPKSVSSIAGVVFLTLLLVSQLAPHLASIPKLKSVPTWVYTVLVAFGLTYFANKVVFSLTGNFWQLAFQAVLSALASVGTRAVSFKLTKTVEATHCDNTVPPMPPSLTPLVFCALALCTIAGCSTSKPFQYGAEKLGDVLVKRADAYLGSDLQLSALDRDQRIVELKAFRTATSQPVDYARVAANWPPVKSWYVPYLEADSSLAAKPTLKGLRLMTIGTMDALIDAERRRRAVLGLFGEDEVQRIASEN